MRNQPRRALSGLILLLPTLGVATAESQIRLHTEAEPISIAMVEGGVSITELLERIGRSLDIDVVFDPRLRDHHVELALRDVGPEEAFDRVAAAAGLMWVALDERSVLFAEDNPQMRRRYEPQVVQTFYLEHADLRDALTLLRSTMGAKSLSVAERIRAVTVRDSAGRVALAGQLLQRHDRAPAMIEVAVRLVQLSAAELERAGAPAGGKSLPPRLAADAASAVVAAGRVVAQPTLSLADGGEAGLQIGPKSAEAAAFELTVSGRYAPSDGTISLEARIEGDSAGDERRRLVSTLRLEPGETWALAGLLRAAARRAGEPDQLVILLTPRIASPATVQASDREPLAVGTEENLRLESTQR